MAENDTEGGMPVPADSSLSPTSEEPYGAPGKRAEGDPDYKLEQRSIEVPDVGLDPRLQGALLYQETKRVERLLKSAVNTQANGTNGGEQSRDPWIDVIARLKDNKEPQFLKVSCRLGDICTGRVALSHIVDLRKEVHSLKVATELRTQLKYSVPEIHCTADELQQASPPEGLDGSDVIIGVVDSGCDFAHRNFRDEWGYTRLLYLWDQRKVPAAEAHPPREIKLSYGREFDSARIDGALLQRPEDPYSEIGYVLEAASHGTQVLDIAAGNGNGTGSQRAGVAPNADLIFVELAEADKSQEGVATRFGTEEHLGNSRYLLEAVAYIFQKASQLRRPCVVNLSLGTYGGPHDGTTLVEKGFDWLLTTDREESAKARPENDKARALVIAAGNAGAQAIHAAGTVGRQGSRKLSWEFHPDAPVQEEECEIWYACAGQGRGLKVSLRSPGGTLLGPVKPGETWELLAKEGSCGYVIHRYQDPNHSGIVNQVNIRVPAAPGLAWTIELAAEDDPIEYDAWIDDGGHSNFGSAHDDFDGFTPDGTLGAICCGESSLGVGAYDARTPNAVPAATTSLGPTRDGREKPEVSAPGVQVCTASGRSHSALLQLSGTSAAAPHVSGLVALLFQLKGSLSLAALHQALIDTARKAEGQQSRWDRRLGFGRVAGAEAVGSLAPAPQQQAPVPASNKPALVEFVDPQGKRWQAQMMPLAQS